MKSCKTCDQPINDLNCVKQKKSDNCFIIRNICKPCDSKRVSRYRQNNKEAAKRWDKNSRTKPAHKLNQKLHSRNYKKTHRELVNARNQAYNSRVHQATPKWLSKEQKLAIKELYLERPKGFHVDHVVPLNGQNVCGLHVSWNLQYLNSKDNLTKSNKLC